MALGKKPLVAALIALALGAWFYFDLGSFLQLGEVQARIDELRQWHAAHPLLAGLLYFGLYVLVTGLSVPGAAVLTLAGGALFGFGLGLLFSIAMVGLASAAILYDTSKILHHYSTDQHVAASLELFASVALLFWYVLRILMRLSRR